MATTVESSLRGIPQSVGSSVRIKGTRNLLAILLSVRMVGSSRRAAGMVTSSFGVSRAGVNSALCLDTLRVSSLSDLPLTADIYSPRVGTVLCGFGMLTAAQSLWLSSQQAILMIGLPSHLTVCLTAQPTRCGKWRGVLATPTTHRRWMHFLLTSTSPDS